MAMRRIPINEAAAAALYAEGRSFETVAAILATSPRAVRRFLTESGLMRSRPGARTSALERMKTRYRIDEAGCWIWTALTNNAGYGVISLRGRSVMAHRAMCEAVGRPIPADMEACHRCDRPNCVNPDHIFSGTRLDNMRDAAAKNRIAHGERHHSAKLTEDIVREIRRRSASGQRHCEIARDLGLKGHSVSEVVLRRKWRRVI